jgi:NAD(P)-dependent dehydrogenase (short-subunit alcohol dehydrogenase family)
MKIDLEDRIIILTGAGGGIGSSSAKLLVECGAHVVCVDQNADALQELAKELPKNRITLVPIAITDADSASRVIQLSMSKHNRLDALIHMSAVLEVLEIEEVTEDQWQSHMDTNINATFFLARTAANIMKAQTQGGRIVLMSSVSWLSGGMSTRLPYATSKGAVTTMARGLAKAYGPHGVTVNTIAPGLIDTPMMRKGLSDTARREMEGATPLKRFGTPEEVASVVTFLASDGASFISGATINVSGGFALY